MASITQISTIWESKTKTKIKERICVIKIFRIFQRISIQIVNFFEGLNVWIGFGDSYGGFLGVATGIGKI